MRPRREISLTTSGIGLDRLAAPLREAGLDRVNVSLDAIRADLFGPSHVSTGCRPCSVGLTAATSTRLHPVKVNSVLIHDVNETEAVPLVEHCLSRG
jgi:cyclic pyranopterin phosphate synthase